MSKFCVNQPDVSRDGGIHWWNTGNHGACDARIKPMNSGPWWPCRSIDGRWLRTEEEALDAVDCEKCQRKLLKSIEERDGVEFVEVDKTTVNEYPWGTTTRTTYQRRERE